MYESFYGLREKPFNLTPDPRFLYLSEMHKEAFAHLIFGIRNRVGFIMVTGEIGTGKTTICRSLLGQLDQDVELAFIFNPCLSPEELLRKINEDFGIRSRAISVKGLIDELNTYLLDRHSKNKNCVLVIDEAQNLTPPVLEQIRLLSNLETERQKLLQIVLIGQPELAEHLELPELRQLNQRITARYHLKPLGEKETMQYIAYRLRIAGGRRLVRFTRSAIKAVYRHSKGTPRVINAICDRALLIGYAKETRDINRRLVRQAGREIRGERVRVRRKTSVLSRYVPSPRLAAAAALIVLVGVFIVSPLTNHMDTLVALLNTPQPPVAQQPLPADTSERPPAPPAPVEETTSTEPEQDAAQGTPEEAGELSDAQPEAAAAPLESALESEPGPEPASEPDLPEPLPPVVEVTARAEPVPAPEHSGGSPVTAAPDSQRTPGIFDSIALVASLLPGDLRETTAPAAPEPEPEPQPQPESEPEEEPQPEPEEERIEVPPAVSVGFADGIRTLEPAEALESAAASLLQSWGMAMLAETPAGDTAAHLARFASGYGLAAEPLRATLAELEALNLPAFVRMGTADRRVWIALLSATEDGLRCSMLRGETVKVARADFAEVYRNEAVVLWRDPAPDADVLRPNMEGNQVRALQHRLRQLGRYHGDLTGLYDTATVDAVTEIQSETALKRDGMAGRQVRMVLSSWLDDFPTPGLHGDGISTPRMLQSREGSGSVEMFVDQDRPNHASPPAGEAEPTTQLDAPTPAPSELVPSVTGHAAQDEANAAVAEEPVSEHFAQQPPLEVSADVPPPLVTVVELPKESGDAPAPPVRDVEALLEEEIYGAPPPRPDREVTPPLYPGAPLVPHRGTQTAPEAEEVE